MGSEERSWLLISKAVSGEISPREQEEMEMIFLSYPGLRSDYENLKNIKLTSPDATSAEERRAMDKGLQKFSRVLNEETEFGGHALYQNRIRSLPVKTRLWWMVAASIAAVVTISLYVHNFYTGRQAAQLSVSALYGNRVHTLLPDGSNVWLNSGSSIKFSDNLNSDGKREITLNGEAYFDVRHDAKHPFIVHAGKLNVVVLGTAFNVKAYADDKFIETTLIRGKVEILNDAKPGLPIILTPDEKVLVSTGSYKIKIIAAVKKPVKDSVVYSPVASTEKLVLPDEDIAETAWVSNQLIFKKESFSDLARQLERWYNVSIVFDNDLYTAKQFTGTFKNQDIKEVMHALQLTQSFHFTLTNNQIHIW